MPRAKPGDVRMHSSEPQLKFHAAQVLARDAEGAVGGGAVGQHDCMILLAENVQRHVRGAIVGVVGTSDAHVRQERAAWLTRDLIKALCHLLHGLVVGRHPVAHETERHGKSLVYVDVNVRILLEQVIGGVEGRRSAAHDRNVPARGWDR